jgi:hypothetical protein
MSSRSPAIADVEKAIHARDTGGHAARVCTDRLLDRRPQPRAPSTDAAALPREEAAGGSVAAWTAYRSA